MYRYPTREEILISIAHLVIASVLIWLLGSVLTTVVNRSIIDIVVGLIIGRLFYNFITSKMD